MRQQIQSSLPKLSVIIPTRNRAKFLANALKSIEQNDLSHERFEVLVIDNGSTDKTRDVANKTATRLQNLRYFFESEPGLQFFDSKTGSGGCRRISSRRNAQRAAPVSR